jgi:hypothetical protein
MQSTLTMIPIKGQVLAWLSRYWRMWRVISVTHAEVRLRSHK